MPSGRLPPAEPYDASKLKTVEQCRTVMDRAKQLGNDKFYRDVFERYCELVGKEHEHPNDPLVRDFYETLGAYEQLLSEKNGRNQPASRTRQKIDNKGIVQSLIDWTLAKGETPGFTLLASKGLGQYTGEFIVMKYAARFPENVVAAAKERLESHGIPIPWHLGP